MKPTPPKDQPQPLETSGQAPTDPDARYITLLMKAVDGLLDPSEVDEWERLVVERPEAARELTELSEIKMVTDGVARRIRADAEIEPPREGRAAGAVFLAGFGLMLLGAIALVGYAGVEIANDPTLPTWVKGAIATVAAGALLLFGYVLRVRIRGASRDPYRHIDL